MTGSVNQVAWAEAIKTEVNAEFDRVRKALEAAGTRRRANGETNLQTIIRILEDKRADVMRNDRASYFIREWQELRDQVRQLILADPRYKAMKARKAERPRRLS